jgi:hypothetical protein
LFVNIIKWQEEIRQTEVHKEEKALKEDKVRKEDKEDKVRKKDREVREDFLETEEIDHVVDQVVSILLPKQVNKNIIL